MKYKLLVKDIISGKEKEETCSANSKEELKNIYEVTGHQILEIIDEEREDIIPELERINPGVIPPNQLPQQQLQPQTQTVQQVPEYFKYEDEEGNKFRVNTKDGTMEKLDWFKVTGGEMDKYCITKKGVNGKLSPLSKSDISLYKLDWKEVKKNNENI
jgi:hypothetical protein